MRNWILVAMKCYIGIGSNGFNNTYFEVSSAVKERCGARTLIWTSRRGHEMARDQMHSIGTNYYVTLFSVCEADNIPHVPLMPFEAVRPARYMRKYITVYLVCESGRDEVGTIYCQQLKCRPITASYAIVIMSARQVNIITIRHPGTHGTVLWSFAALNTPLR